MTLKHKLLIALGFLFLLIGSAGIFLPILPTTPFVILAATCFSGSPKLSAWLNRNQLFHDYITNYKERTGLKKRTVITGLISLWGMLTFSAVHMQVLWAYILFVCIGLAVTVHILYMSLPKKK